MSKHTARVMVAVTDEQYGLAAAYVAAKGEVQVPMTYPTLYLQDEGGEVRGVMARYPSQDNLVVIGKASADSGFRMLQLAEAMERLLAAAGVKGYLIPMSKDAPALDAVVRRIFDVEPWGEDDANYWFTRRIPDRAPAHPTLQ